MSRFTSYDDKLNQVYEAILKYIQEKIKKDSDSVKKQIEKLFKQ